MERRFRRQLFVDRRVQGALLFRAVCYCVASVAVAGVGYVVWHVVAGRGQPIGALAKEGVVSFLPALVALLLALPLVLLDCLRVTNRFVGPLYRMRRYLRRLAQGESVEPILFRTDDFWHEVAEEFNAAVARLERDKRAAKEGGALAAQRSLYPIEIE